MTDSQQPALTLAQALERVAEAADRERAGVSVTRLLEEGLALCRSGAAAGAAGAHLRDVEQRLQVWHDVWPRLGRDAQFRAAVAREAHQQAARLAQPARGGTRDLS